MIALLALVYALAVGPRLVADRFGRGTLIVAHLSGKFSARPNAILRNLTQLATREHADVITLTEVSPDKFRQPLAAWARRMGWDLWHPDHPGGNECAVLSRLPIVKRRCRPLTRLRLKVGRTAPTHLIEAKVRGWGWFSVVHTPAHTGGLTVGWPTIVYRSILDTLAAMWRRTVRARWTILGDLNLDIRRPFVRRLLTSTLPHASILNPVDQHPTEGGRVIDGGVTTLVIVEPARTVASVGHVVDHDAIVVELANHERHQPPRRNP